MHAGKTASEAECVLRKAARSQEGRKVVLEPCFIYKSLLP